MPVFTPPDVPEGVDVMEHIWTTRNAIQSWSRKKIDFEQITLGRDLKFELLTHPRLAQYELRNREMNSLWGIPLRFAEAPEYPYFPVRSYTIAYQEA